MNNFDYNYHYKKGFRVKRFLRKLNRIALTAFLAGSIAFHFWILAVLSLILLALTNYRQSKTVVCETSGLIEYRQKNSLPGSYRKD